ncbi:MAG: hypothetical protein KIT11_01940 [Fimbriimonadaceae bacterium]|nr:hypothetical protein [Fimbriimonadaceae bacterium]QYK54868.1 MAG: hypothetical protein KF733_07595 [Fimbriimonadaceae bacterium]
MKNKLYGALLAAIVLAFGTTAFAQKAGPKGGAPQMGGPGGGRMMMGGKMQEAHKKVLGELGLNANQKTKITQLDQKRENELKALRGKAGKPGQPASQSDREAMRGKMQKIQADYQAGMKATLTPAQFTKYEARMKEEMAKLRAQREKEGGRQGGAKAGGGKPAGKGKP